MYKLNVTFQNYEKQIRGSLNQKYNEDNTNNQQNKLAWEYKHNIKNHLITGPFRETRMGVDLSIYVNNIHVISNGLTGEPAKGITEHNTICNTYRPQMERL